MDKQVLIVDDSAPMRPLRGIIDASPGLHVCGEAYDGIDSVEKGRYL